MGLNVNLTKQELLDAYGRMRSIRAFHKEFSRKDVAGLNGAGSADHGPGSEASAAAIGLHVTDKDLICASGNRHIWSLGAGAPLPGVLHRIVAPATAADPAGEPHVKVLTNGSPAQVLGAAIARRALSPKSVTLCQFAQDTAASGRVFDLLQAAKTMALPIVFVMPRAKGTSAERVSSIGIEIKSVPERDFYPVFHAAGELVSQARAGRGPAVLEMAATDDDPLDLFRRKALEGGMLRANDLESAEQGIAYTLASVLKDLTNAPTTLGGPGL
jgi:TPP-dependent pyruvate/acetoin dehydrogenase alpha subunit